MRTWLAQLREQRGLSQYAMADAAGISQSYYAGIELGTRGKPLGVPVAKSIAQVLGFDWTRFYDDEVVGQAVIPEQVQDTAATVQ